MHLTTVGDLGEVDHHVHIALYSSRSPGNRSKEADLLHAELRQFLLMRLQYLDHLPAHQRTARAVLIVVSGRTMTIIIRIPSRKSNAPSHPSFMLPHPPNTKRPAWGRRPDWPGPAAKNFSIIFDYRTTNLHRETSL